MTYKVFTLENSDEALLELEELLNDNWKIDHVFEFGEGRRKDYIIILKHH